MSLLQRLINWWLLDCQSVRRTLRLRISDRALMTAYFARHSGQYTDAQARLAAQQSEPRTKRLMCALRWDGLGTPAVRAICWHCGSSMPDPHGRRECSVAAPDIMSVIAKEEAAMLKVIDRARGLLSDDSATTITGERLSYLHQTHGIDSSVAESILGPIPEAVHAQYLAVYASHRTTGIKGKKVKIVVAH